jgi:sporulation protein YlmC with PRC-barrel domain
MLHNIQDLKACKIQSTDGDLGKINDFYFDDEDWVIRYLVVDTNNWFFKRKALISPITLKKPDWLKKDIQVNLTQQQINDSPDISVHEPVSRQQEIEYYDYYGYPAYWGGGSLWGEGIYPDGMMPVNASISSDPSRLQTKVNEKAQNDDPHLRSWEKIKGYKIHATDGEIGHIQDLLVDELTFAIRYVIVQTNNWWIGHQVLIAPQWFSDVQWSDSTVSVNHSREAIKNSPSYDSHDTFDRSWEIEVNKHYGTQGYWSNEPSSNNNASKPNGETIAP